MARTGLCPGTRHVCARSDLVVIVEGTVTWLHVDDTGDAATQASEESRTCRPDRPQREYSMRNGWAATAAT